jgi:succinate dehydrogenase/fumarate reductase iron-sulfur protein
MEERTVRFRILRYRPGVVDPPCFQIYKLSLGPRATVMDGLEALRLRQDPDLLYRHSCHHASCGTCACKINGTERLACVTNVWDLGSEEVVLEPLDGFTCTGDLVVDMTRLYRHMPPGRRHLRPSEWNLGAEVPDGFSRYERFENCIECGACVSSCPVSRENGSFLGPAGLAAIHMEAGENPGREDELLELAGSEQGAKRCERALRCSRVCPAEVYPARHIWELLRHLEAGATQGEDGR